MCGEVDTIISEVEVAGKIVGEVAGNNVGGVVDTVVNVTCGVIDTISCDTWTCKSGVTTGTVARTGVLHVGLCGANSLATTAAMVDFTESIFPFNPASCHLSSLNFMFYNI